MFYFGTGNFCVNEDRQIDRQTKNYLERLIKISFGCVGGISCILCSNNLNVHSVDLFLVDLGSLVTFQLKSWGESIIFNRERQMAEMDTLGFLKTGELVFGGKSKNICGDFLFEISVLAESLKVTLHVIFLTPFHNTGFIGNDN